MNQNTRQEKSVEAEQSRFIGRVFVVPFGALLLFVIWVVVASVLTPLRADETGAMLVLRFGMIAFGALLIGGTAGAILWRLTHWRYPY